MKVLMVVPTPFFSDRGCHVRVYRSAIALREQGHEVVLCTYPLGRDIDGVETVRTWPVPWYRKLAAGPSWHKIYIDVMLTALTRKWIRTWNPDVIHAHLHEGACVAYLARGSKRIPLVLDYQGSLSGEIAAHKFARAGGLLYRLFSWLEEFIEMRVDAIVTSTANSAERLSEEPHTGSVPVAHTVDSVDTEHFRPGVNGLHIRMRYGIPEKMPVIVYAGLLNEYQGIDALLEALRILREKHAFHTLIIGYPNVQHYRSKAQDMGLTANVTFTGQVRFEDLPAYLNAADVAVSPKHESSEGNGKLYAYMACGLPVAGFDTTSTRQILRDAGLLVKDGDTKALADALARLTLDKELAAALGARARAYVTSEDEDDAGALGAVYEVLVPDGSIFDEVVT
ncbi:MAG: glycosyltransferase family 4 protein [Candidatus Omnitrophota bacterium]|nr:glycosyltransferase family 4 protein [Candidatus Omnitrophota bacterium]